MTGRPRDVPAVNTKTINIKLFFLNTCHFIAALMLLNINFGMTSKLKLELVNSSSGCGGWGVRARKRRGGGVRLFHRFIEMFAFFCVLSLLALILTLIVLLLSKKGGKTDSNRIKTVFIMKTEGCKNAYVYTK